MVQHWPYCVLSKTSSFHSTAYFPFLAICKWLIIPEHLFSLLEERWQYIFLLLWVPIYGNHASSIKYFYFLLYLLSFSFVQCVQWLIAVREFFACHFLHSGFFFLNNVLYEFRLCLRVMILRSNLLLTHKNTCQTNHSLSNYLVACTKIISFLPKMYPITIVSASTGAFLLNLFCFALLVPDLFTILPLVSFLGAHINPAVTFGMAVIGAISPLRAAMYITAHCGGGIAGAALLYG